MAASWQEFTVNMECPTNMREYSHKELEAMLTQHLDMLLRLHDFPNPAATQWQVRELRTRSEWKCRTNPNTTPRSGSGLPATRSWVTHTIKARVAYR